MRALVQRVTRARCTVEGRVTGAIEGGLLVLLGAAAADGAADADWLAQKIAGLLIGIAPGSRIQSRRQRNRHAPIDRRVCKSRTLSAADIV